MRLLLICSPRAERKADSIALSALGGATVAQLATLEALALSPALANDAERVAARVLRR